MTERHADILRVIVDKLARAGMLDIEEYNELMNDIFMEEDE